MLEALRRYIQDYGWNWGIVHSLINRKFGTDYTLEELQHFYNAAPGRSQAKRAPFSNEPKVKAPGSRLLPRAGCFSSLQLPGLHPAEALQAPYDRGAGALKMRLEFPHVAARVIHLQQGAIVRLRPRLARIGR